MTIEKICKSVLRKITPTTEEEDELSFLFINLRDRLQEYFGEEIVIELNGSVAKGTALRGNSDLDIFLKFPIDTPKESFKKIVEKLKNFLEEFGLKVNLEYASHPYIHSKYGDIEVDVVPCYNIVEGEDIISAVDRSPHHTHYVIKNLFGEQKREVRLLKQFLKATGVYGADEEHRGFSGYLCELLVIEYGSFINVLESEIKDYRDIGGVIHFSDPVDKNRNVAAALGIESYSKFVIAARKFLEIPSLSAFDIGEPIDFSIDFYKQRFNDCQSGGYLIKIFSISNNKEILHSKARKYMKSIQQLIEDHDFTILSINYHIVGFDIYIIVEEEIGYIPPLFKKSEGPSIFAGKEASNGFIKKHGEENIFVEEDKLMTFIPRKYQDLSSLLKDNYSNVSVIY
jgi:tRNA nucleotidyltransferase (CCA-adding enzyme)